MVLMRAFRCALFFIFIYVSDAAPVNNASTDVYEVDNDLASDLENWMGQLPDALKLVPIKYLAIPGTHDSFTSDITGNSKVSPDGEDILKQLEWLTIVKVVMANWSKTQAYDVTQQLLAGIRYFDLRVCYDDSDGNLYFCHGLYSTDVESVLNGMSTFLNNHPQEVVILDVQHVYNFTDETHEVLIGMLKDAFGTKLLPVQSSMDGLTLIYFTDNNYQVLVVYRSSVQSSEKFLWSSLSFPTPWYNTMNTTYLINSLNNGLATRSNSYGYISQSVLTPSINDILGNLLSTLRQKCAVEFESARTSWIGGRSSGAAGVNIIISDFIDLSNNAFSKSIINLNSKLLDSGDNVFKKSYNAVVYYINALKNYMF